MRNRRDPAESAMFVFVLVLAGLLAYGAVWWTTHDAPEPPREGERHGPILNASAKPIPLAMVAQAPIVAAGEPLLEIAEAFARADVTIWSKPPDTITFSGGNGQSVTIHLDDGHVVTALPPDEAARVFWEAVTMLYPSICER